MSPISRFPSFLDAIYGFGPPVDLTVEDRMTVLYWFANPHLEIETLAARLDIEPDKLTRLLDSQEGDRVIGWLLMNYGRSDLREYRLSGEQPENPNGVIRPPLPLLSEDQRAQQLRAAGNEVLAELGFGVNDEDD